MGKNILVSHKTVTLHGNWICKITRSNDLANPFYQASSCELVFAVFQTNQHPKKNYWQLKARLSVITNERKNETEGFSKCKRCFHSSSVNWLCSSYSPAML